MCARWHSLWESIWIRKWWNDAKGAREELLKCRVLPSIVKQKALQEKVIGFEVQYSIPSNMSVGDPLPNLPNNTLENIEISFEIEPNLEDTRSLDVMEGSI